MARVDEAEEAALDVGGTPAVLAAEDVTVSCSAVDLWDCLSDEPPLPARATLGQSISHHRLLDSTLAASLPLVENL